MLDRGSANFREFLTGEVRRMPLPRTPRVNREQEGGPERSSFGPTGTLIFVYEGLPQVEDGRGPQAYEDRRLTLA